jgi:hypothetical protein
MTLSPYPVGFPSSSHDAVETVWLQAWDEFETAKRAAKWNQEIETALITCIMKVFGAFSKEATRLNLWPLHETKKICNEFLAVTAHKMEWSVGEWLNYYHPTRLTLYEDVLSPKAEETMHRRPEWRAHIDRLLAMNAAPPDAPTLVASQSVAKTDAIQTIPASMPAVGRPRNDSDREWGRARHAEGMAWKDIAKLAQKERKVYKTAGSWCSFCRSTPKKNRKKTARNSRNLKKLSP